MTQPQMKTIIIVAMNRDHVIGQDGGIPWHIPEDLKFFKRTTTGHAIIMGRKTFESIGKPLPNRRNLVISRNPDYRACAGVEPATSLESAIRACRDRGEQKAFVIGGAQVYAIALNLADEMIITHVDADDVAGDTYFPDWDKQEWERIGLADESLESAVLYRRR